MNLPETADSPLNPLPVSSHQHEADPIAAQDAKGPLARLAFLFSALLSPYLVIPIGTLIIIYARSQSNQFFLWAGVSIFFSTGIPALFVVANIRRGKITDVHVMEREQRGGPFVVAIISNIFAAGALYALGAPASIWGLSLVVAANGLVLFFITRYYKISMHVAVLTSVVLAAMVLNPGFNGWYFVWLIPALIWARQARGRHSVKQGLLGFLVAGLITWTTLSCLPLGNRTEEFIKRVSADKNSVH